MSAAEKLARRHPGPLHLPCGNIRKAPRGLGQPYTVHGFRSTFSDWAHETTGFPNHVIEMALAHAIPNKAEAAYRRGELLDKRRELMQTWADYLDGAP